MPRSISPSSPRHAAHIPGDSTESQEPQAKRPRLETGQTSQSLGALNPLPPHPAGPNLSLTPARAELWKWTRRPADELLTDNSKSAERLAVLDDAHLLPAPATASRTALPASTVHGLHLPSALPIPEAPRIVLPAGEPAEVAAARSHVVGWLSEMRSTAAELHMDLASPDDELAAFRKLDKLAAPAIVAALNAEDPGLRMIYAHNVAPDEYGRYADQRGFGSVAWEQVVQSAEPGRWRILIDNDAHNMALDVMVAQVPGSGERRASVVALNPSTSPSMTRAMVVAELANELRLPADWSLLLAEIPAQKSLRSCRIFALSMALKCRDDASLDSLHQARLRGDETQLHLQDIDASLARPDDTDSELESDRDSDSESTHSRVPSQQPAAAAVLGQEVVSPAQIAGPQYMKHAQSRSDVLSYIAARGSDATRPVNRKQQTLLERHDAHRVVRQPARTSAGSQQSKAAGPQINSASIELKRISFLDKAIRHAAACNAREVQTLSSAMHAVDTRWTDRYGG